MTPTRDELLTLAKEAGATSHSVPVAFTHAGLERFAALLYAHQAQAEPAAWQFKNPEDTCGAWKECSKDDFIYWATRPDWETRALYTGPPSSDQTWNEAIAAAKTWILGRLAGRIEGTEVWLELHKIAHHMPASLARPSQAQEPSEPISGAVDQIGLDVSRKVMALIAISEPALMGGNAQRQAQIQCLIADAIAFAQRPVSGAVDEQAQRLAFEEWAKPRGYSMERTTDSYKSQGTKSAWRGWFAHARARQAPTVSDEPIKLSIIRKWPEGFAARLEHVWKDLVGFIPNYKLYDLQRVLAEFGLRMEVYEEHSNPAAAPVSEQTNTNGDRDGN